MKPLLLLMLCTLLFSTANSQAKVSFEANQPCTAYYNKKSVLRFCEGDSLPTVSLNGRPCQVAKETVWVYGAGARQTQAWEILTPGTKKKCTLIRWDGLTTVFTIKKDKEFIDYKSKTNK